MKKEKFAEIVDGLIEIKKSKDLSVTDDAILSCAERIYVSENINESKKENIQSMKEDKEKKDEPATPKQIELLKSLGMKKEPENLTKIEASRVIELNLNRRKEK